MEGFLKSIGVCVLSAILIGCSVLVAMAQAPTARRVKVNAIIDLDWGTWSPEQGNDDELNQLNVMAGLGYFINDIFEIGPEISYNKVEIKEQNMERVEPLWSLGLKANAHFNTNTQVTPYIGVNAAFSSLKFEGSDQGVSFDDDDTTFIYGAQMGFDYFLFENVSINPELRYITGTFNIFDEDWDLSSISFMFGIAAHF